MRASLELVGATRNFRAQVGADVQRKYEQSFPSLIAEEVRNFRTRENRWQTPGTCAKLTFSPPSGAIKVRKNTPGQLEGSVQANQGGVAAAGRWRVTAQSNGTFSPTEARGGTASFQYNATTVGPGVKLSGTFRATSTAGVAEGTWMQDTTFTINRIEGSLSDDYRVPTMLGPSVLSFTGNLTFDRFSPAVLGGANGSYAISSGGFTLTASGIDITGVSGCSMTGSKIYTLPPGQGSGTFSVQGTLPNLEPPFTYGFQIVPPNEMMTITRHSCPPGAETLEGSTQQVSGLISIVTTGTPTSLDGVGYTGSEDQTVMGGGQTVSWNFTGKE